MGEPVTHTDPQAKPAAWRRRVPIALALCGGTALSVAAFVAVRQWEDRRLRLRFQRLAGDRAAAVDRGIAINIEQLRSIRAFFAASERVERHEFHAFTTTPLGRHKAIHALLWAPRVAAEERQATEARARADNAPGYEITEDDGQGRLRRAPERPLYYPVMFLEPRERDRSRLGFDLATDPVALAAIDKALADRKSVATEGFDLGKESGGDLAFRVFLPIYHPPSEEGIEERTPENLHGFAIGVFRLDELLSETLRDLAMESVELRLFDLSAPSGRSPLAFHGPAPSAQPTPALPTGWTPVTKRIPVADREWEIECTPTHEFFEIRRSWHAWGVLVLGPLVTALATLYATSIVGRTSRIEELVAKRTAELRRANERLEHEITSREQVETHLEQERNLLRALIDNMPDHIYVKDTRSRFVVNNKAHIGILGAQSAEEVEGKTDFEFFPRELAERYFADEQHVLDSDEPIIAHEEPVVTPSGERRWVSTTKVPFHSGDGKLVGLVGISRDVTDHRRAEEALAWEARVNEALADLARALLSVDDLDEISSVLLDHARRLTGSELGYVGYIDPDTGYLVCPTLTREIWDTCQVHDKDIVFKDFRGIWGWVLTHHEALLTNAPERDPHWCGIPEGHMPVRRFLSAPATIGTMLVGQVAVANASEDYTEQDLALVERLADLYAIAVWRQRAEAEIQRTADELARSNRELEMFAYVASHDLQEPLRMVGSFVQLLAQRYEGRLDAEADEFIHFAVDGANRMRQLIEDLLAFSRVGTRAQPLEPTDSEAVLAQALENLAARIHDSGAEVTHGPLPTVMGDERQLVQVFQNLVSNAIKFRGDAPPRIHISAEERDDEWAFAVRDNGIGIDPGHADRIFEIFKRLHTREEYPGTGIGLAICKKTVERHGGRIWVESQPGQGATFRFTLPKAEGDQP